MSITVEPRTRSTVRTEYSVSLWAKRENRPRLIIGAPRDSATPFRTERREIIRAGLASLTHAWRDSRAGCLRDRPQARFGTKGAGSVRAAFTRSRLAASGACASRKAVWPAHRNAITTFVAI